MSGGTAPTVTVTDSTLVQNARDSITAPHMRDYVFKADVSGNHTVTSSIYGWGIYATTVRPKAVSSGGSDTVVEAGKFIEAGYDSQIGAFIEEKAYTSGTSMSLHSNRYACSVVIGKCSSITITTNRGGLRVSGVKNGVATLLTTSGLPVPLSYTGNVSSYDYVYAIIASDAGISATLTITD